MKRLKIENKPVEPIGGTRRRNISFADFVIALRNLEVGQSFLMTLDSNDRMAIAIVQILYNRRYVSRKEGERHRIGRTV